MSTNKNHTDWVFVISDAESEIAIAKGRISVLRASIREFRRRMEAGEPLPEGLERKESLAGRKQKVSHERSL
jgi:hypothetical protein